MRPRWTMSATGRVFAFGLSHINKRGRHAFIELELLARGELRTRVEGRHSISPPIETSAALSVHLAR
jgi:hypothetical protein